jgi:putative membrane protein
VLLRLLQTWAFNVAAIFVASAFVDGVDYADTFWVLLLAAFVFAAVNLVLKPIVKALAFPVIVLSLGVALFFVNMLMLYVTTWIVGPFDIHTFWDAVWATIVIWAVNAALHMVFGIEDRRKRRLRRR